LPAVVVSMLVAVFGFASGAAAVLYDLNVANGNYNVAANWINHADSSAGVPTDVDFALVRNGGTLNITAADGDATAYMIRVGAGPQINPDSVFPDVDPTPPPTYAGTGTLNWTGGNIFGNSSAGPRLNVGQRDNATDINYTGIVNHSGGKISLNTTTSFLVVGSNGTTPTPTSVYNLMPGGTIGVTAGSGNTNNGINVRNGTFNMTGGDIVSDDAVMTSAQRAMTISSTSGTQGSENVATANFSGGTVDVYGGMRMASSSHTKAYVTISGGANLNFRAVDFQLASNQTNSYAQVDMSGGSLSVGDVLLGQARRLIIGDSGTGVFNLSGGTVNLNHSLVVCNNPVTAKGTLYQTGGTLTVRDIEVVRNTPVAADLTVENGAIIIDGPTAVFTQQDTTSVLVGQTTIGQRGKGRFELRQGQANLRVVEISETAESRATFNVFGGKMTIQDGMIRNNVTNDGTNNNTPNINLTGGELELTPAAPATAISWNTNMELNGTDFDPRPGGLLLTNVGSFPNKPATFSLNSGSVWDLNIANGTLTGADWVDVPNGTGALNGGMLNILPIGGYTPANGDMVRILSSSTGLTLNSGAVTVSDPNWALQMNGTNTEIYLKYTASAGVPGDYNGNGKVDAADYVLWRNGGPLANEVDAPGTVNGADYTAWRARFGNPPGAGSGTGGAVPEPTTIVLVGMFAAVSLALRRTRCGTRYV
jgi:hypothetical protein